MLLFLLIPDNWRGLIAEIVVALEPEKSHLATYCVLHGEYVRTWPKRLCALVDGETLPHGQHVLTVGQSFPHFRL